jgi:hypothetical protein
MPEHRTGNHEQWLAARRELLEAEFMFWLRSPTYGSAAGGGRHG